MTPVRRTLGTLVELASAALIAVLVSGAALVAISTTSLPAFNTSWVARALTTVAQVLTLAGIVVSVLMVRRGWHVRWATAVSWASLSAFATVTLAVPLAATKLYLFGISVDQEFRNQYFTRLTDSAALRDMTYADLPPFYPGGWFWIGGRVANLLGLAGWEAFKPYSIGSLAVAATVALVLWSKLIRLDRAIVLAVASTAITLAYGSPEPYGAVIAVLVPPVMVLAWGGIRRNSGGWAATVGVGLFLGIAACFYTLFLGLTAFAVVLMALVSAGLAINRSGPSFTRPSSWRAALPALGRLAVAGVVAGVVALSVWFPYVRALRHDTPSGSGGAQHYLPESASTLPLPMVHGGLIGFLTLLGTLWIVVRIRSSMRAQALGIGVLAVYLWSLLSMMATAAGTTLLAFRLESLLLVLLGAAGVFGFLELASVLVRRSPHARAAIVAVGMIGALAFVQNIPGVLRTEISVAYSDTDGAGVRADRYPPGAESYYHQVDDAITAALPVPRHDTVVLTTDHSFLAFYPYLGFQAITSHYANPLGDFAGRAAAIERWSKAENSDDLVTELDTAPWRAPAVFLFREAPDGYALRLSSDVYPNDPNVKRYTVTFPEKLFDDPRFSVQDIGPFTLVIRIP